MLKLLTFFIASLEDDFLLASSFIFSAAKSFTSSGQPALQKIFVTSQLDKEEILLQHGAGASKPGRDRAQRSDVSSR